MPRTKKTPATETTTKKENAIPLYTLKGESTETVALPASLMAEKENKTLLAQYVRVYQNNQRQGTASTKTRLEVVGSTKKIYRQKGTGGARHGSRKSPTFVGGGVAFGPHPRDFSLSINKKQKKAAFAQAFTHLMHNKGLSCVENAFLDIQPKTKELIKTLKTMNLDVEKDSVLIVLPKENSTNVIRAARNIKNVGLALVDSVNTYDLLRYPKVLFVQKALEAVQSRTQAKHATA